MDRPSRLRVVLAALANVAAVVTTAVTSGFVASWFSSANAVRIVRGGMALTVSTALLLAILRVAKLDRKAAGLAFGTAKDALLGAAVAVATVVASVGIAGAFGGMNLTIASRTEWPTAAGFAASLFTVTAHAAFEEVATRAGLTGVLGLAFRKWIAIGVPAVMFGLAHAGNHGASAISVANTVLAALVLVGLFLLRSPPALAACTGFHATWNFALAMTGIAVSGTTRDAHFLSVVVKNATWSGGAYGIEASPATTIVYAVAAALVLRAAKR